MVNSTYTYLYIEPIKIDLEFRCGSFNVLKLLLNVQPTIYVQHIFCAPQLNLKYNEMSFQPKKKNDLKQKNYWPNEPWWYDHIQQCRSWHRRKKIAERYCCWRNRLDECRTNRICFPLDIRIDHVIIWITFLIEFNMRMQLNYLNVYSLFLLNLCVKWYNYISVTA